MSTYTKFPDVWIYTLRARSATAADWSVAAYLLERGRFQTYVTLPRTTLRLHHTTLARSVNKLAQWGLIQEKRRHRKAPVIRPLYLSPRQPGGQA
ncbi:MAG: hypothetical protein AUI16_03000 [Alphaproteobacteria bacterium 13_2_20CM_2_64_7]|jgi:predicted transcriptional regulator|nr:MAG: hypothetical protein AUI16_03000 [Alphaproteobacteria bacterium 13_2_20CM_2_64_7]